jgi:hypothetical protein
VSGNGNTVSASILQSFVFTSVYLHVYAGILFFTAQASICRHASRLSMESLAPGSPTRPLLMPGAVQEGPTAAPSGVSSHRRVEFLSSIAVDKIFASTMAGWHTSAPLGVCCCSLSSLWLDPVSILSNPLFGTPALHVVLCAHPHAKLRFLSGFSHALTYVILLLPFPGVYRCEAAATRIRRRLLHHYYCIRESRGSRGRRRSRGASVDAALARARVAHSGGDFWSASRRFFAR